MYVKQTYEKNCKGFLLMHKDATLSKVDTSFSTTLYICLSPNRIALFSRIQEEQVLRRY